MRWGFHGYNTSVTWLIEGFGYSNRVYNSNPGNLFGKSTKLTTLWLILKVNDTLIVGISQKGVTTQHFISNMNFEVKIKKIKNWLLSYYFSFK